MALLTCVICARAGVVGHLRQRRQPLTASNAAISGPYTGNGQLAALMVDQPARLAASGSALLRLIATINRPARCSQGIARFLLYLTVCAFAF